MAEGRRGREIGVDQELPPIDRPRAGPGAQGAQIGIGRPRPIAATPGGDAVAGHPVFDDRHAVLTGKDQTRT